MRRSWAGLPELPRAQREFQRPDKDPEYVFHSADQQQQRSWGESRITKSGNIQDINNVAEAESLVSAFPKVALKNQVIASLLRHYIDFLAPWYDFNDSQSLFGTLVP
ncbi:uncharacterized protein K444DRAFT_166969 [Hyaloscypha bicolor E]|uniref:Uncharacterized protein n=1 Tax=Hyaloscypha bicolor E TaxID=1095630 RepID=A0A2J6TT95_9HELO|nr:uncharacterized protein K444DRAFT_166969 [Hyaloscypha bicolor E]PMD66234.1 hypothetical protein K444DRAFT_166969 [Hyaloscypha bicolor E]